MEVESKTTWPDEMQAYAAGMAEGYLTKDLIYDFWQNTVEVGMLTFWVTVGVIYANGIYGLFTFSRAACL